MAVSPMRYQQPGRLNPLEQTSGYQQSEPEVICDCEPQTVEGVSESRKSSEIKMRIMTKRRSVIRN